jgi:two-component system response regulator RegA
VPEPDSTGHGTLLVVDDDAAFRDAISAALGRRGWTVTVAPDAIEAEKLARQQELEYALEYALVDVRMPGPSGIDLVATLRSIDPETRIVVLTGYGTIANAVEAMRAGAADYLTKPVDAAECERALLGRTATQTADIPTIERVEWEYIQRVLSDSGGNVSEAARKLRMHRRTLQRKLSRWPPK